MLRARLGDEGGFAMVLAVFATALLATIAVLLIDVLTSETKRSAQAEVQQSSHVAAESGVDAYIAKLTDDPTDYLHELNPAESTRRDAATGMSVSATGACTDPAVRPASVPWTYGTSWTYPTKDRWCALGNGYEYNLQITPPSAAQPGITILATGRSVNNPTNQQVIEAIVARSSITDFQMLANVNISYGVDATTNGKIYSNGDITHNGTASDDLYANGRLYPSTGLNFTGAAKGYDRSGTSSYPDLSTVPKLRGHYPIDFQGFLTSFDDIKSAAENSGGISLNDSHKDGWWLTFAANGTVSIKSCMRNGSTNIEDGLAPICTAVAALTNLPVPNNGAIHVEQTAIVSGVVNGRVTVASENDIVIGGTITYAAPGDDVLGLEARDALWVAEYVPTVLFWSAATLTQSGTWQSASSAGSHNAMTFTGSSAIAAGLPQMAMFDTRTYNYDTNLLFLPPPWFPTLEPTWDIISFRDLPGP